MFRRVGFTASPSSAPTMEELVGKEVRLKSNGLNPAPKGLKLPDDAASQRGRIHKGLNPLPQSPQGVKVPEPPPPTSTGVAPTRAPSSPGRAGALAEDRQTHLPSGSMLRSVLLRLLLFSSLPPPPSDSSSSASSSGFPSQPDFPPANFQLLSPSPQRLLYIEAC